MTVILFIPFFLQDHCTTISMLHYLTLQCCGLLCSSVWRFLVILTFYLQLPYHTHHTYPYSYLAIHMCIRLRVDVCARCGYGLVECRVGIECAGKIGYTTLRTDLSKSRPVHNFILYLPLLIAYLTVLFSPFR